MFLVIKSEDFALGTRSASVSEYDLCLCRCRLIHTVMATTKFSVATERDLHPIVTERRQWKKMRIMAADE